MDQAQIATTVALIEASTLSQVDKEYFVAALKRNGLTAQLESEIQSALKTAMVKSTNSTENTAAEDQFTALENERERRTQELDDTFAPRFQSLDQKMTELQGEYDTALAALNTDIDQRIDQMTKAV